MPRFDVYVPSDLQDLVSYLAAHPEAHILSHGSDLMPRIRRGFLRVRTLVDLSSFQELHYVRREGPEIRIGTLTTIAELRESPVLADAGYEAFRNVAEKFGAVTIRNLATVGGNVAAAASSEDLLPVLLTLDARVTLQGPEGERQLPVRDFVIGKRQLALKPGEFIREVRFAALGPSEWTTFQKIGRRNSLIIALVSLALYLNLDPEALRVREIRLALNRVRGKIPERATRTEEALRGEPLTPERIDMARRVLRDELQLTADFRASGTYRLEVAQTLFTQSLEHATAQLRQG